MHFISFFLAQTVQVTGSLPTANTTEPINWAVIIYGIGAAILAIGALLAWIIRSSLPKILESFEKRTNSLDKMVEVFPATLERIDVRTAALTAAIDKLPDALVKGFTSVSNDIRNDIKYNIDVAKDQIIKAVHDDRLEDIAKRISQCPDSKHSQH